MDKQDKIKTCKDCNEEFTFTVGEQEFYEKMGFVNEPVRCASCRNAKKNRNPRNNEEKAA